MNNTITRNGGGLGRGLECWDSSPTIINTIVWENSVNNESEIYLDGDSSPFFRFSDIGDTLWPGEGNISVDPLFRDPDSGDFHLMSTACGDPFDSPCIDAGDPAIFDYLLNCDWGLGAPRSDMGAYGGRGMLTGVTEEQEREVPVACGLLQNYPNPFNAATTLSYALPQSGPMTISIYNLLGQRVATVFQGEQQAGRHSLIWDAAGLPSGVYFARLEAGEYSQSVKMVLLK